MSDILLVVIGNTEIASIPGISVAGASPELTKFTPPADVEYIFYGKPLSIDAIPVTPEGHPTPAIITKASYELANFGILPVRGGSILPPQTPYIEITAKPGKDFRFQAAIEVSDIIQKGKMLGMQLEKMGLGELVIGESIPGGTTTAQAVLLALGYEARTSSASPKNPQKLKEEVVEAGLKRIGLEKLNSLNPWKIVSELGDPMLATVVAISLGFRKRVVLAGGTQMLAIAAILKALGENLSRFLIATTKYVVNDPSASFVETAEEIGVDFWSAELNFSRSSYKGLRDYEMGYVKEGVGAGGSVYLAAKGGISIDDIVRKVEELYSLLEERID
ncbi:MAG: TIGR00303 family protein [Archaeoglobus sp.]|nr:TIGR00303 family protein [Archaeoglobus sp.]